MLYTIEDTTLTAMGDAVRSYTGKYTSVDESTEQPFFELEYDTRNYEHYYWDKSNGYLWVYHIDFKTLLGDKSELLDRVYVEYEYEAMTNTTNTGMAYGVYSSLSYNDMPYNVNSFSATSVKIIDSKVDTTGEGSGYLLYAYGNNYPYLMLRVRDSSYNAGAYVKVKVKLWACDADGKFIELNRYTPLEMVDEVYGIIDDFANAPIIPEEAFTITGHCGYKFGYSGWDWFIKKLENKITTNNISYASFMFYENNGVEEIPFDINISSNAVDFSRMFYNCNNLKSVPYIVGPEKTPPTNGYSGTTTFDSLFNGCYQLRYIPNDFFWKIIPNNDYWEKCATLTNRTYINLFNYCYSLREHPDISMLGGVWTSAYSCIYYYLFNNCYSLDKAENLPVCGTFTSNAFISTFDNCYRLKELTFAVNEDGTPKTANWKNQTINTKMLGYMVNSNESIWLKYNHGITADKKVSDDASYQLLKDNPDYYTTDRRYSLYNHDAAVRTINSLPDCSAYGTNTIFFGSNYGLYTDEGPISNLTEEEIAVAVAKGWTVSLS